RRDRAHADFRRQFFGAAAHAAAAIHAVGAVTRFFLIARLSSSARSESSASLAFIRKASRPPRWSTVLNACAETRSFTERPSVSDIKVTFNRLGRNRRLVLRLEWLTLCPTCAPLPVSSQRRDMAIPSSKTCRWNKLRTGARPAARHPRGDRGPIVVTRKGVKPNAR